MRNDRILTAHEVAILRGTKIKCVTNLIIQGKLFAYQMNDNEPWLIPLQCFIRHLISEGKPLGKLEGEKVAVILTVGMKVDDCVSFNESLHSKPIHIQHCGKIVDACLWLGTNYPDCIVVDFAIGLDRALEIVHSLRQRFEYAKLPIFGLLEQANGCVDNLNLTDFTETFRMSDFALLAVLLKKICCIQEED